MRFKRYILSIWRFIDPIYYSLTRLKYIDRNSKNNIFRVRLTRYKGRSITLSDGTQIKKNDLLIKIHLHNVVLLNELVPMMNEIVRSRRIYHMVEKSMPGLARYVINHPNFPEIKGIIGITNLNRGSHFLGFETYSISNPLYKQLKWLTLLPIHFLSASNPIKMLRKHTPAYLFMSKNKLLNMYIMEEREAK